MFQQNNFLKYYCSKFKYIYIDFEFFYHYTLFRIFAKTILIRNVQFPFEALNKCVLIYFCIDLNKNYIILCLNFANNMCGLFSHYIDVKYN